MNPRSTWLALFLFLASCDKAAPEEAPPPFSNSVGPMTAAPPTPVPPVSPADALAIAAQSYAAGETPLALAESFDDPSIKYFDVIDCNEEMRGADPSGKKSLADEIIARRIALLRRSLQRVGYSNAVIDAPLAAYTAHASDANGYAWLAAALEANRAARQPRLPPIRAEGGCGAAETPIIVRSRPAGAHIWLITKFAFDLCRVRRLDPWDRNACDRWSEIGGDRPVELSGAYAYQANWPDGRTARGSRRIDPMAEDTDDGGKPQIITVDQQ